MSDTPRTDEVACGGMTCKKWVAADFARKLERENAALRADRERLDWLEGQEGHYWAAKRLYRGDQITRAALDIARKEAQP